MYEKIITIVGGSASYFAHLHKIFLTNFMWLSFLVAVLIIVMLQAI